MIKKVTIEEIEQMIKDNVPFKIKVTPEESRKIRQLGSKNGKVVIIDEFTIVTNHYLYFNYSGVSRLACIRLDMGESDTYKIQEIQLIEGTTFKTQQDIWKYLSIEGNMIQTSCGEIYKFEKGNLTNTNRPWVDCSGISFPTPSLHKPYISPKQWYEEIPKQGILCLGTQFGGNKVIVRIKRRENAILWDDSECSWDLDSTVPLTEEEVKQYIYKGK